jgi:hypothetical protein
MKEADPCLGSAFFIADALLDGCSATRNKMQDDGDHGEQQKQMDKHARALKHDKAAEPHHYQDNR